MYLSNIQYCNRSSYNFHNINNDRQKSPNFRSALQRSGASCPQNWSYMGDGAVEQLLHAIDHCNLDRVKYLIENNLVNPNAKFFGKIPVVCHACLNGVGYGGSSTPTINYKLGLCKTPNPAFDIASYIIGLPQVDINAVDERDGDTALLHCCYNEDDCLVAEILKRKDVDINAKNYKGQTAYDFANRYTTFSVIANRLDRIALMLENYANKVNLNRPFGDNPIFLDKDYSSEFNSAEVTRLTGLFNRGFNSGIYIANKATLAKFIGVNVNALDAIFLKDNTVYRKVMAGIHPDLNQDLPYANEKTLIVNMIYQG